MKNISVLTLFRKYISYSENTALHFDKRKQSTIIQYANKYRLLNDFLIDHSLVSIKASKFNMKLIHKYYCWLVEKKGFVQNYAVRCFELCKTVFQWALEQGILKANPIGFYKQKKTPPTPPQYLTPDQLRKIEAYTSESPNLQKAADMLIVQLNTGFDYGDFGEIKKSHLVTYQNEYFLTKPRNKNGERQIMPVSNKLHSILEKHNFNMQLLSNPAYNHLIKVIAKELDIDVYLTSKEARKLFMMNKLNNEGYSMAAVSRMGGHKTIKTTEAYYAQVNIALIYRELMEKRAKIPFDL